MFVQRKDLLGQLWLALLPVLWRVALLPVAIAWTPPAECGWPSCVALDIGLSLILLAPFAAIAHWEGDALRGLGLERATAVRGLAAGFVAALCLVLAWLAGGLLGAQSSVPGPGSALRHAVAGILEECAYRGFVQRRLMGAFGPWLGIFGAAVLFAIGHGAALATVYQQDSPEVLGALAYFFVAGCVLGALFAATRSIWASALPHAVFNVLRSTSI